MQHSPVPKFMVIEGTYQGNPDLLLSALNHITIKACADSQEVFHLLWEIEIKSSEEDI
jgi:hypothetical protein